MTNSRFAVRAIECEPHALPAIRMAFDEEFECITAVDAETAFRLIDDDWSHVVMCHQPMPRRMGVEFPGHVRERWPKAFWNITSRRTLEELNLSRAGLGAKTGRFGFTGPAVPHDIRGERLLCVSAFLG